jgi:rRNA maturation RNase YbeY
MSVSLQVFNECGEDLPLPEKEAQRLFLKVMRKLGRPGAAVNLIARSDEELRQMKKKYFGQDLYTDVITFLLEEGPVLEGEIYISPRSIRKNAEKYGQSPEREFARVLIHGAAHLCGYRDYSVDEKEEMRALEEKLLTQFYDK